MFWVYIYFYYNIKRQNLQRFIAIFFVNFIAMVWAERSGYVYIDGFACCLVGLVIGYGCLTLLKYFASPANNLPVCSALAVQTGCARTCAKKYYQH